MGFLRNLLSGREVTRLEELITASPAPSLFLRLAQLYREMGEDQKAEAITRRGAKLFPESEQLMQAAADADKVKNEAEKHRLRSRIEQYPSPMLYAKLAEICLREGSLDEAERTCMSGTRAYPDYGGLWSVLAGIFEARGELPEALEYLEKATELDKYNYNALIKLAEIEIKLGNNEKGRKALESILFFAPDDVRAQRWLNEFDKRVEKLQKEYSKETAAATAPTGKKDRTTLLDSSRVSRSTGQLDKHSSGVGTGLQVEIRDVRRVEGVRGSVLIDPYGMVIASDLPQEMDEELTCALITNICRTTESHAENLTIGEFEEALIDAGESRLHILRVNEMIMGVFASPETKPGLLQRAIHTFAEKVLERSA